MFDKIAYCIERVRLQGTQAGTKIIKDLKGKEDYNLYELRPLDERIFMCLWNGNHFVMLSHYKKDANETDELELARARRLRDKFFKESGIKISTRRERDDLAMKTWDEMIKGMSQESIQEIEIIRKRAAMVVALIQLRESKGWTQAELARRAGMKQSAIARFESDTTAPRIDTIIRVAMALGVDLTLMPMDHSGHQQAAALTV